MPPVKRMPPWVTSTIAQALASQKVFVVAVITKAHCAHRIATAQLVVMYA